VLVPYLDANPELLDLCRAHATHLQEASTP
jgi:hypothetical protein